MTKVPESYSSVLAAEIVRLGIKPEAYAAKIGCTPEALLDAIRSRRALGLEYADAIAAASGEEGKPNPQFSSRLRKLHAAESSLKLEVAQLRGPMREIVVLLASEPSALDEKQLTALADAIRSEQGKPKVKKPALAKTDAPS